MIGTNGTNSRTKVLSPKYPHLFPHLPLAPRSDRNRPPSIHPIDNTVRMELQPWEARAAAKRADTLNKIYPRWRLSAQDVKRASERRDLTGPFIQGFLSQQEISILSMDTVPIVNAIKQGQLTSVQVATAFLQGCCRCTSDRESTGRPLLFSNKSVHQCSIDLTTIHL